MIHDRYVPFAYIQFISIFSLGRFGLYIEFHLQIVTCLFDRMTVQSSGKVPLVVKCGAACT